jgi:NAD+ synthase (glutamine-hydrolysing)
VAKGMARLVLRSIQKCEADTLNDLRRITGDPKFLPKSPQDIVGALFHTAYMSTKNSGEATRSRARRLAEAIGSYHSDESIDEIVAGFENVGAKALDGFRARFESEGGSSSESLARQNIQARSRMVLAYERKCF